MIEAPSDHNAYLARLSNPAQKALLTDLRARINAALPGLEECISYGMPAFRIHGKVVGGYAALRKGSSFYPFSGGVLDQIAEQLAGYSRTKSALHFSGEKPIPDSLLQLLLQTRLAEIRAHLPIVRYRPHHFLCSLGFQGKGYSDAFTANMSAIVIGRLRANGGDDTLIEVTPATDDICAPCPKRRGALCTSQDKIAALDAAHAEALHLTPGDRLTWGEAQARILANVPPGSLKTLCQGCEWEPYGMCEEALAGLHAK